MPTYRNIYTGKTVTSDSPHPSFAASGRWVLDGGEPEGPVDGPQEPPEVPERPSEHDRKADWEAYAQAIGVYSADEGDVTKAQLIERCEASAPQGDAPAEQEGANDAAV